MDAELEAAMRAVRANGASIPGSSSSVAPARTANRPSSARPRRPRAAAAAKEGIGAGVFGARQMDDELDDSAAAAAAAAAGRASGGRAGLDASSGRNWNIERIIKRVIPAQQRV